jgi:hypothetical protein
MARIPRIALGAMLVALALVGPAPGAQSHRPAADFGDYVGAVGQPVTLDGEQIHTVVRTERWYGGGSFFPKAGDVPVAIEIRVEALAETSYNPMYYGVRDSSGTTYGRVILGYRYPSLDSSAKAPAGTVVDGWITFSVPAAKVNDLTLVYHMHAGFGSTLTIPLGAVPESATARLGQSVALAGEQVHTVVRAERWAGGRFWKAPAGKTYVTWYVKVRALKPTTVGQMYYSLRSAAGTWYHGIVTGRREPQLVFKGSLAAGKTAQGWVTLIVPKSVVRSLTLVYHVHDNGPNLLVPLPIR